MKLDGQSSESGEEYRFNGVNRHFLKLLENLWVEVLGMAAVVEHTLRDSLHAFVDRSVDLAGEVLKKEPEINRLELRIEEACLQILALHQPVASDLRRVAAVFKIGGQLERMADLATHIVKRVKKLGQLPMPEEVSRGLDQLGQESLSAVRRSIDALANNDADAARQVIASDGLIDRQCRSLVKAIKREIRANPDQINFWLRVLNTAKNLERLADHATNISETVIYMREGVLTQNLRSTSKTTPTS